MDLKEAKIATILWENWPSVTQVSLLYVIFYWMVAYLPKTNRNQNSTRK